MSRRGRRVRLERLFWNVHARTWSDELDRLAREERVERLAAHASPGARILDLGCGTGAYARALAERGFAVVGLDFAPAMLARASAQVPAADFVEADLNERLPFTDASFDHALCVSALQCVHDPAPFLADVRRVLRPGGVLLAVVVAPRPRPVRPAGAGAAAHVFWFIKLVLARTNLVHGYRSAEAGRVFLESGFRPLEQRSTRNATELLVGK